jgi:hypothetical protein
MPCGYYNTNSCAKHSNGIAAIALAIEILLNVLSGIKIFDFAYAVRLLYHENKREINT